MRVGILGPLQVLADGQEVVIGGVQLRAFVIRLALDAGRVVTAGSLSQVLWPDGESADPVHALHSLTTRLRRALPDGSVLRTEPGGYCLDVPAESVDALHFERLARDGQRALARSEPALAASRLREALGLWRGEPLADVAHTGYAQAAAARLGELRLAATEDRIAAELEIEPDLSHLVAELTELAATHPLRERPRGLLIDALHADARPAEALAAYEQYRALLAEELGADPGSEVQERYLSVLRGEPARRPAGPRRRGNVRTALTTFIGREDERRRVEAQLWETRLVTLVGPGGVGKTRLATTVASGMVNQVPGGVWVVEFAPVVDSADVPGAVLRALDMRGAAPGSISSQDPVDEVVEALAIAETVLVLDNCEHVAEAAARRPFPHTPAAHR